MRMNEGRSMTARSEKRFRRNGSIASGQSGPPRLKSTTAIFTAASPSSVARSAHARHQLRDMLDRRFRQDAMAQVEDEWDPSHGLQNIVDISVEGSAASDQRD